MRLLFSRNLVLICLSLLGITSATPRARADVNAMELVDQAGFHGGFVVHLGVKDGRLTEALRQNEAVQVHGLVSDRSQVGAIRERIRAGGAYGNVSVDYFEGDQLPYVDNLVNLLITEDVGDVADEEIMRVLVPGGVALVKRTNRWEKRVKPWPDDIDEWSHYLHDPSGNAVAHDDVVGPPRHLQWVGSPRWSRHHDRMASMSALVSTGGRLFYVMDEGSRISILLPPKWKLIARDAFNGSILWKRDIKDWQSHLWPLKSGPTQLARRLVAADDAVYTTLGFNSPCVALDPASGETLRTYEGTDATEEILAVGDMLLLVVRKGEAELADYAPLFGRVGDQARVREFFWDEEPRVLMAFDAATGRQLWAKQSRICPLTLAADDAHLCFHDGENVVCVDRASGDVLWTSPPALRRTSFTFNFGPRLVLHDDVVLFAGGNGKMAGYDAASGAELWTAEHPNSGYQSPQDLMVVDGLVWCAPLTATKDSGVFKGRDPRTGEVKQEFAPNVDTYWFHHRCYISKATDNFIIPSRTGIEFVDPKQESWNINHWVRGGCLYGVMPCNGLTYAPPHNCACYPEAKLYGFNALAPLAPTRPLPEEVDEQGRLQRGPAYETSLAAADAADHADWPTFRHDGSRSGTAPEPIPVNIGRVWTAKIGGRLTQPVVAAGSVYFAQIDQHTVYALDEATGSQRWTFTTGGRIDSPPTVAQGRVVFGCADGWVYCLNAVDGQLAWRYRGAPIDRRTMAYEQLESLWPVHGSVLIRENVVHCVAGRSNFLDGGLRLLRLDLETGEQLSETIMDESNPQTGGNLQEVLQTLQMPVGLPDILSTDDRHIYMKSQKFDLEGNRLAIGPNSGNPAEQASVQHGDDAHLFAPMGFLDDSWFHRSYWVHGQSFAGGHSGYFQAGRFAPSGRIMVKGNGYVYGYGRKPEYLRWTTVLEHELFAAEPSPPEVPEGFIGNSVGGKSAQFPITPSLNPAGKPLTVEAWVTVTKPNGVIVARGGSSQGFALALERGRPTFLVRSGRELSRVAGPRRIVGGWHHVAGVLTRDKQMRLYVDGRRVASSEASGLLKNDPQEGLEIGGEDGSSVGEYKSPNAITGIIDEVRLYFRAYDDEAVALRYEQGAELGNDAALAVSFDDGSARDLSVHRNNGTLRGGKVVEGRVGRAVQFSPGQQGGNQGNSLVEPKWSVDLPIFVRAMVLAGGRLFVAGPPDVVDEVATFEKLTKQNPEALVSLLKQDRLLQGESGGVLLAVNPDTGDVARAANLRSLPAWDGLISANGRLFLSTTTGELICLGGE